MSGPTAEVRLRDLQLRPIAEKVAAGERLTSAEGVVLYQTEILIANNVIKLPQQTLDRCARRKIGSQTNRAAAHIRVYEIRRE